MLCKRSFGWHKQAYDHRDRLLSVTDSGALPTSIDLRGKLPPVYDQGQLGSCTANAVASCLEYDEKDPVKWIPSRLAIYFRTRQLQGTVNYDSGATLRGVLKAMVKYGFCHETLWPYRIENFRSAPPTTAQQDELKHRLVAYEYYAVQQAKQSLKSAMAAGFPVAFGIVVHESFMAARDGNIPDPTPKEKVLGGHAITLVGYDDDGVWFRNSWSAAWGQGGYGRLRWAHVLSPYASDFWVIKEIPQ